MLKLGSRPQFIKVKHSSSQDEFFIRTPVPFPFPVRGVSISRSCSHTGSLDPPSVFPPHPVSSPRVSTLCPDCRCLHVGCGSTPPVLIVLSTFRVEVVAERVVWGWESESLPLLHMSERDEGNLSGGC